MSRPFTAPEWEALREWADAALDNWDEARGIDEKEEQIEYWTDLKNRLAIEDISQRDVDRLYDYGGTFVELEEYDGIQGGPNATAYDKIKRLMSSRALNPAKLKRRLLR